MQARILAILRWCLIVWGGASLVGVLVLAFFMFGPGNRDSSGDTEVSDVQFVLNWSELGTERIERVVNSHKSARSLTGDHLDAYAIKLTKVEAEELLAPDGGGNVKWFRGDQLPPVVEAAVTFASTWQELTWFPSGADLRSSRMYVLPWSVTFYGTRPEAAELIFVRPEDDMLFFFAAKQ
jgi:hypothetical protein